MYQLNYGPHHPSTHGVLRLLLDLEGEKVKACEPIIGYLHRGVEKLCETKQYISIIPYIDRLDYLAPSISEHAYVLALEKGKDIIPSRRAIIIRTIIDELTRISCHAMAIGCATWDIGSLSLFLYAIQVRESIMDIFDFITGRRMHLTYYIPGGVLYDINEEGVKKIKNLNLNFFLEATEKLALDNTIFRLRTKNKGIITKKLATEFGISGVNLRATGIKYDIRQMAPYGIYKELDFEPIVLNVSDSYNRTYIRYLEIKQSLKLIKLCLDFLEPGEIRPRALGIRLEEGKIIYKSVENSRGEFGVHIITGTLGPKRIHFKSPSFAIIQMLKELLINQELADVSMILGSLDFIMGDCDR